MYSWICKIRVTLENQMYDFQKIVGMSGSFNSKENRRINTYFERLVRYAIHKSYSVY